MLDPPPPLPRGLCCHLRRVNRTTKPSESSCEYILLVENTRFGATPDINNVILSGPDDIRIRDCHAIIRAVADQLHGNIRHYELLARRDACVFINYCQIESEQVHVLNTGDYILFGDKLTDFDCFSFQFELANDELDYPVMRDNLQADLLSFKTLTIFNNSLAYKIGNSTPRVEDIGPLLAETQIVPQLQVSPEIILSLLNTGHQQQQLIQQHHQFVKENLMLNCSTNPSVSLANKTTVYNFLEVGNEATSTLSLQQPTYKTELPSKFDVDIFEVVKKIASRIVKQESVAFDDEFDNNNTEKSIDKMQAPLMASVTNLNVYPCSTGLTSSSSMSPSSYTPIDFRHTPSASSTSTTFNQSDSGNFSANESGSNSLDTTTQSSMMNSTLQEEEEEMKQKTMEEEQKIKEEEQDAVENALEREIKEHQAASKSSLEMLAALASSSSSSSSSPNEYKEEEKSLEIFIPLVSCSDGDDSLSPTQILKGEKMLSPTPAKTSTPHRISTAKHRQSRQSTHDGDDSHAHTTKQLKLQTGLDLCRRKMLKYIANNLYTTQIVEQFEGRTSSLNVELRKKDEEPEALTPVVVKIEERPGDNEVSKPLALYPDGDEYVTKTSKQRRNSKQVTTQIDTITEADQRLFATLLFQLTPSRAPSTLGSTHSSAFNDDQVMKSPEKDEESIKSSSSEGTTKSPGSSKKRMAIGPSRKEQHLFLRTERMLPRVKGVGRHTLNKLRSLYRFELDRSSAETIPIQRHRLIERCKENRVKCKERERQLEQKKQAAFRRKTAKRVSDLPSPKCALGSPVAKMPIIKKSSTGSRLLQNVQKRQSTDLCSVSIHQLVKDPNFDGFLVEEYGSGDGGNKRNSDPFQFDEDEDPFSGRKNTSPLNARPFFATENARSAAISANAAMHNQQHPSRRPRKRPQPVQDTDAPKLKSSRGSSASKAKRTRRGRKANEKDEEPCASSDCVPKKVHVLSKSKAIEWVACDSCELWFHNLCVFGSNRRASADERFLCSRCQHT